MRTCCNSCVCAGRTGRPRVDLYRKQGQHVECGLCCFCLARSFGASRRFPLVQEVVIEPVKASPPPPRIGVSPFPGGFKRHLSLVRTVKVRSSPSQYDWWRRLVGPRGASSCWHCHCLGACVSTHRPPKSCEGEQTAEPQPRRWQHTLLGLHLLSGCCRLFKAGVAA